MSNRVVITLCDLVSRCNNQIPNSILFTQKEISRALTLYYGIKKRWKLDDLEEALRDKHKFSRYCPGCDGIQIKLVCDDELRSMSLSPDMLDLKRRSTSKNGWYIPFLSERLFNEFEEVMRLLRKCRKVIE